jgi:hypothetical protein
MPEKCKNHKIGERRGINWLFRFCPYCYRKSKKVNAIPIRDNKSLIPDFDDAWKLFISYKNARILRPYFRSDTINP